MLNIAIMNRKGGVGKTTTSYNLAYGLSKIGKRVILIDLDIQSHSTKALGILDSEKRKGLYDSIIFQEPPQIIKITDRLDLIPANPKTLKVLESHLAGKLKELKKFLDHFSGYDFCIFDCNPNDNNINDNALTASNYALIPTECQYFSKDGLVSMIQKIDSIRDDYNENLKILGFLVTKYNDSFKQHKQILKEINNFLKEQTFKTIIRQDVKLAEAPEYSKTIYDYSPYSKGTKDYLNLIQEILDKVAVS